MDDVVGRIGEGVGAAWRVPKEQAGALQLPICWRGNRAVPCEVCSYARFQGRKHPQRASLFEPPTIHVS